MKHWQRRSLGILTLGGGAIGVAVALSIFSTRSNPIEWIFCAAFVGIYAWGILCGVKLLENVPDSERSSLKYWLVQTPAIGSPVIGYFLSSGFHVTVALQFSPLKVNANFLLGSTFSYSFLQPADPWFIGVNIFAAMVSWWLYREVRELPPN